MHPIKKIVDEVKTSVETYLILISYHLFNKFNYILFIRHQILQLILLFYYDTLYILKYDLRRIFFL